MNILLLGGTGAMGESVANILSKKEIKLLVTSRQFKQDGEYIKYAQGNALDIDFLSSVLEEKKWDCIIDFMVYSELGFKDRIDLLLSSTKQYVFISSARVYANSEESITETSSRLIDTSDDSEFLRTNEYPLSKARQENLLFNSSFKNWTIVRPYITYATNRLQLGVFEKEEWLYRALKKKSIILPESIMDSYTTMTSGTDVAIGIVSLINQERALENIFNITNVERIKWADVLQIYLDSIESILGYRPVVQYQNNIEFYEYSSRYPIQYDRLFHRVFDNDKISGFIDVNSFQCPQLGLKESMYAFLENPYFKNINWKAEAYKDKKCGEHTSFYEIKGLKNKLRYLFFRYIK